MQYLKIVPTQWSILPAAGSCIVQYSALQLPSEPGGFFRFDAIQQLSYFFIVFVTAPLAILTGLAMSPALDNRFKWYQRLFGNRQIARSMHFIVMVTFVAFFAIHMLMVASTQFSKNLNGITLGVNEYNLNGVMLTVAGILVTIAFQVWAVNFSWTHTRVLQRISNLTAGRVMDLLFDHYGPRAEYREQDISPAADELRRIPGQRSSPDMMAPPRHRVAGGPISDRGATLRDRSTHLGRSQACSRR